MTKEILESEVYKEMESVENPNIVYPDCNFSSNVSFSFTSNSRAHNVATSVSKWDSALAS